MCRNCNPSSIQSQEAPHAEEHFTKQAGEYRESIYEDPKVSVLSQGQQTQVESAMTMLENQILMLDDSFAALQYRLQSVIPEEGSPQLKGLKDSVGTEKSKSQLVMRIEQKTERIIQIRNRIQATIESIEI